MHIHPLPCKRAAEAPAEGACSLHTAVPETPPARVRGLMFYARGDACRCVCARVFVSFFLLLFESVEGAVFSPGATSILISTRLAGSRLARICLLGVVTPGSCVSLSPILERALKCPRRASSTRRAEWDGSRGRKLTRRAGSQDGTLL